MAKYNFNAELYDNPLTEKEGDYIARPTVNTTIRNEQMAERIVEERTFMIAVLLILSSLPIVTTASLQKIIIKADKDYPPYTFINDQEKTDKLNVELSAEKIKNEHQKWLYPTISISTGIIIAILFICIPGQYEP